MRTDVFDLVFYNARMKNYKKECSMRFINIFGSIAYIIIGILVLIQGERFGLSDEKLYSFSGYVMLLFITTQIVGILFRKAGRQSGFFWDLIFSVIPLFISYESYSQNLTSSTDLYEYLREIYLYVGLLDFIIFTAIAHKFSMFMNEYVTHDR